MAGRGNEAMKVVTIRDLPRIPNVPAPGAPRSESMSRARIVTAEGKVELADQLAVFEGRPRQPLRPGWAAGPLRDGSTAVIAETLVHGHAMVPIRCAWCDTDCRRRQNAGGGAPLYCGGPCQRAAKRHRQKTGTTEIPTTPKPPSACPGCGTVERLKRRGGFAVCESCRARLEGACMRKAIHGSEEAALAFNDTHGFDQRPYRCAYCDLWHLTSDYTADELPGDAERGAGMRAAGFSRQVFHGGTPEHPSEVDRG